MIEPLFPRAGNVISLRSPSHGLNKEDGIPMRMRYCFAVLCALGFFAASGCDLDSARPQSPSTPNILTGGPGGPGGGGPSIVPPLLLDMLFAGEGVCVGADITLIGLNFSSDLTQNEVVFTAGMTQIEGLPLRIEFPGGLLTTFLNQALGTS